MFANFISLETWARRANFRGGDTHKFLLCTIYPYTLLLAVVFYITAL
jgi:hypothetical protein